MIRLLPPPPRLFVCPICPQNARKLKPSLMCRFILFVRQQQATQRQAGNTVGGDGSMDLLG